MATRRTRQISLKECYDILKLQKGADLAAVKTAYRRRAFELHPDLHPGDAEASRQFQKLNEAYVALSAMLKPAEEARQRAEARKGTQEHKTTREAGDATEQKANDAKKEQASQAYAEQDVLRDLLNDPFARRVFEDIYSELARKEKEQAPPHKESPQPEKKPEPRPQPQQHQEAPKSRSIVPPPPHAAPEKGVAGAVKGWLRKQLDEEQSLTLPASGLFPGRKVRLQIRPSMSEDVTAVDITLPPDFVVGKPLRLRGLGKKVGPWQGDLYLTIYSR